MFAVQKIPQVFMNIDYKLNEPIADKNAATYFHDFEFNSYAKLLYHFKNIHFSSRSLRFKALLRPYVTHAAVKKLPIIFFLTFPYCSLPSTVSKKKK